jgi:F-type H+-transporting ATPase subunit delta
MKLTKESRKLARLLFRASFTNNALDGAKVRANIANVARSKPRHYLDVLKDYHRLLRLEVQKRQAVIESAAPLNKETSNQIVAGLKRKYGADLTAEFKTNPELLGGVRIKVGSDVWDGSVRSRLMRLEDQLSHA